MSVTVYIHEMKKDLFEADCKEVGMGFNFIAERPLPGYGIHGYKLLEYTMYPLDK